MNEIIREIKEVENFEREPDDWKKFDGWKITTDEQEIFIGVSNGPSCCENFGYLVSEDSVSPFLGAELREIKLVDKALNVKTEKDYLDSGDIMFINLETSKGTLQFSVYNAHNGYYGHTGVVISKQLNEERDL